jgi:hypothetical protein
VAVFIIKFLLIKAKVLIIKWFQWHLELQHILKVPSILNENARIRCSIKIIFITRQLSTVAVTLARCPSGLPFSSTPNPTPNPNLVPDFKTWPFTIKI